MLCLVSDQFRGFGLGMSLLGITDAGSSCRILATVCVDNDWWWWDCWNHRIRVHHCETFGFLMSFGKLRVVAEDPLLQLTDTRLAIFCIAAIGKNYYLV